MRNSTLRLIVWESFGSKNNNLLFILQVYKEIITGSLQALFSSQFVPAKSDEHSHSYCLGPDPLHNPLFLQTDCPDV